VRSWEQYRFDALVEAARRVAFGHNWWEQPSFAAYARMVASGVPIYRSYRKW
jgi:hypothetical protein